MSHPDERVNAVLYTRVPKNMGGYPVGDKNNSGMNIYPAGFTRMIVVDRLDISPVAFDSNFGAQAALIEKKNGAIGLITGYKNIAGSAEIKKEGFASVRCIKTVKKTP